MRSLLIIEKDEEVRSFLVDALSGSFSLTFCANEQNLTKEIQQIYFDLVLLDLGEGSHPSLSILNGVKNLLPFSPIVATCRVEKAELVVSAMKLGAFDFIIKPYTVAKLKLSLDKAIEHVCLKHEINTLRREQDIIYDLNRIIAKSQSMQRVIVDIRRFAGTDSTILMTGETGTGKSLLAGAIHYNSLRREKPFVTINCANIQETLLESELFGHEKGSFTGADKLRIGRFEQANGGSVFLDEIGELSLALQAKLLRVIDQKAFERVGGNRTIHSDVRIIAATNKDLERLIADGQFREDLYYRINVLPIRLPPLRERQECLVPLSHFLLAKIGRSMHKNMDGFSPQVITTITNYTWPGNIRQLANTIERALLLEDGQVITQNNFVLPQDIPTSMNSVADMPFNPRQSLTDSERTAIVTALEKSLWIQKDAAHLLGISPRVLNHKIKKLGITHHRWRCNS